jgi:hypothetical protein
MFDFNNCDVKDIPNELSAHWSNRGPQTKHVDRIGGQVVVLSLNYGYLDDDHLLVIG